MDGDKQIPEIGDGEKRLGKYLIKHTLGRGATAKVKLAINPFKSNKLYAVKIMNNDLDDKTKQAIKEEVEALQALGSHPNIVGIKKYKTQGKYEKNKNGNITYERVDYMVIDFAKGGELFDFISISGAFDEPLARYYFIQMMEGLDYCHRSGFAHRDLKPENILLDENYKIKIADFGFAAPVDGRDGKGVLTTYVGTENYMAPEIALKQDYQGRTVDLFACGIILFIMVAAHPPFTYATPDDSYYKCIASNRGDLFWRLMTKGRPKDFFSEDFKDLIISMLQLDPVHRPTMSEILRHPWVQGDIPSDNDIISEIRQRKKAMKAQAEQDMLAKEKEKVRNHNDARAKGVVRSGNHDDADQAEPQKKLDQFILFLENKTQVFTSSNPDIIEEAFLKYLEKRGKEEITKLEVSADKYKYKFVLTTKDQHENIQSNKICVKILKVNEKGSANYCIDFNRIGGPSSNFYSFYNDVVSTDLKFAHNAFIDPVEESQVQNNEEVKQIQEGVEQIQVAQ